jgi:hypothetical protein
LAPILESDTPHQAGGEAKPKNKSSAKLGAVKKKAKKDRRKTKHEEQQPKQGLLIDLEKTNSDERVQTKFYLSISCGIRGYHKKNQARDNIRRKQNKRPK